MIVNKITTGFVIQSFDTEKKEFVSQDFIAGDEVSYEKEDGTPYNGDVDSYLPFDMVQPE